MANIKNVTLDAQDMLSVMDILRKSVEGAKINGVSNDQQVSSLAVYLLNKAGFEDLQMPDGTPISKSTVDEITLDFTRSRTLSEEQAELQLNFIFDQNPYLKMFNSRIVNKLVVPIQARAITRKNLISNEQKGSAVTTVNRRIIHEFGINLYLEHVQMQKDIPLQTVINNLYNPGWEAQVAKDIAVAFGNDILLLVVNGLGGSYASTENFYDLNKGFVKILQEANGSNTNTYGSIKVTGFLGKHLTPQKFDATDYVGAGYTGANLITVMRKMYELMPTQYRTNPSNVWMMSQQDVDLYVASRSDMTSPSNTTREQRLTDGAIVPFMGHDVVAIPEMPGINTTHEADATFYGSIIFGDPKNIDIASDKSSYMKTTDFNARGSAGPTFEYTYDMYFDVQVGRKEAFVIAFKGAKVEKPVLIDTTNYQNGSTGELASTTLTTPWKFHCYCDTKDAKIYWSQTEADLAASAPEGDAELYVEGAEFTLAATTYFRAYRDGLIASDVVTVTKG